MADEAIQELTALSDLDPNDLLLVKESGTARAKHIKAGNTYFGQVEPCLCILRLTSGTPNTIAFIDEGYGGEHRKLNFSSVSMDSSKISLTFSKSFDALGAFCVGGDDVLTGDRFFGVEPVTGGIDIYVADNAGSAIDPTTDNVLTSTNNAIWVHGFMFVTVT